MKKIIVLILFTAIYFPVFSQDNFCESIIVEGKSSVKMEPEIITFNINLSVKDTNYTQCAELALQKIEGVKSEFIKNGIDEKLIKTTNYSIREEREHDRNSGKQIFVGYRADIPVLIKTEVNNPLNDQIFEIIKTNFQADFRLNFELSPVQIEMIKKELIQLAVKDAKSKAEILAESAEVELGEISKIQYGEPQSVRNFTRSNYELRNSITLAGMSTKAGITTLTPPKSEMRTSVMIAWDIE